MKIMLAGSFSFAKELLNVKKDLENLGHEILTTDDIEIVAEKPSIKDSFEEELKQSIEHDVVRDGLNKVNQADALLVCNYKKGEIEGYLGTSVLMEIAIAYFFGKKIFFLNDYDKKQNYGLEISVIKPIILNGNLEFLNLT